MAIYIQLFGEGSSTSFILGHNARNSKVKGGPKRGRIPAKESFGERMDTFVD